MAPMRRVYVELVVGAARHARAYSSRPALTLDHPQYAIWSPNTGVGKTVISLGIAAAAESKQVCPMRLHRASLAHVCRTHPRAELLCHEFTRMVPKLEARMSERAVCASVVCSQDRVNYVKPVQTGFPDDSDGRLVARNLSSGTGTHHFVAQHAIQCFDGGNKVADSRDSPYQPGSYHASQATTLFAWSNAVSPHLAVEHEGRAVSDETILHHLSSQIASFAAHALPADAEVRKLTLIEMAGGICSPGPSGSLQVRITIHYICSFSTSCSPAVASHEMYVIAAQQQPVHRSRCMLKWPGTSSTEVQPTIHLPPRVPRASPIL